MASLPIGILGAGKMGAAHANAALSHGAQVVAVHDVRLEAAQALAADIGAELAAGDLQQFFSAPMAAAVIATPPPVRLQPIEMACRRGIHLMIEKPPALTLDEGRRCLQAIEAADVIAAVGFQLRYNPLYERLRQRLRGETVHLVRTVCTIDYYLTYRMSPWFLQSESSGGPIAEQAIHLLDCVRFVTGEPQPVRAFTFGARNMALERTEFDADNALQLTYELDNGVLGVHTNHCGHDRFSFDMEVIGPHLRLRANATEGRLVGYLHGADVDEPAPERNSLGLDKTGAWLRAVETGDRSLVRSTYAESLNTLALVEAGVRSRQEGAPVEASVLADWTDPSEPTEHAE